MLLLDLLTGKILFFFVSKYLQTFCQGLHLLCGEQGNTAGLRL